MILPAMVKLEPKPTPPCTVKAPVVALVVGVMAVMCTGFTMVPPYQEADVMPADKYLISIMSVISGISENVIWLPATV